MGVLDSFRREQREALWNRFINASTPDEAYSVACEAKASEGFWASVEAEVAVGMAAANELEGGM